MDLENLTFLIAFGAGILSFASPCVLPLVPVYIGHLTGSSARAIGTPKARRVSFLHALTFVLGFSLVFVVLGASVGLVGYLVKGWVPIFSKVGGVLLIVMGLHLIGIIRIPLLYQERKVEYSGGSTPSYVRSFLVGSTFSLGWTPCVGPILGSILTLAATSETVGQGALLLVAYCIGLGVPFLITGLALGTATRYLKKLNRHMGMISLASGVLLIGVGILIFTNRLVLLNRYFDFFGLSSGF